MKAGLPGLALAGAFLVLAAQAQTEPSPQPAPVTVDGNPPSPMATARALAPYGEFRPSASLSWHPLRREMLVRHRQRASNQVHLLTEPGARLQLLTEFPEPVNSAGFQPALGNYFVFPHGEGGSEASRLHRFDIATRTVTPLTPEGQRVGATAWNTRGDTLLFATPVPDRSKPARTARTIIHLVDPLDPGSSKVLATLEGGGWGNFDFSQDDKQLALQQVRSAGESHLWVMDLATRKLRRVTRAGGEGVHYGPPRFLKDGKSLLATSDRGSEFRRLVQITLADSREYVLTPRHKYDVDDYAISFDANRIALTTNENGSHVLRFLDLGTKVELTRPPLFDGVISGLAWRRKSDEVAFTIASARTAGDVFSFDVKENKLTRWTNGNNPEVNTSQFAEPRLVKWKSFDAREITAFVYDPPAKFTGNRPVLVVLPGGPGSQARAGFLGPYNYCIDELGITLIFPNLRGSTGFGKSFLRLAQGSRQRDSAKDIAALRDWIRTQPGLDANRVMVTGAGQGDDFAANVELVRATLLK